MVAEGLAKLAELLRRTQAAHHDFEIVELEGKFDEQWPSWYAQFLIDNHISQLLGHEPAMDVLNAFLEHTSKEFQAGGGHGDWAAFTARRMLDTQF